MGTQSVDGYFLNSQPRNPNIYIFEGIVLKLGKYKELDETFDTTLMAVY